MKFFRKFFRGIKEWWVWLTSRRVGAAINNGSSYEEVCKIVEEEMAR
jgi:hypothetical protein